MSTTYYSYAKNIFDVVILHRGKKTRFFLELNLEATQYASQGLMSGRAINAI